MLAEEEGLGSGSLLGGDSIGWGSKSWTGKVGRGSEELTWIITVGNWQSLARKL